VAERLRPFGVRLLAADPVATGEAARAAGAELVSLEGLLGAADIVTLHVPLTAATRNLISREALARMRPGAWLVNTARGGLVDEGALLEALETDRLAGAALDVLAQEPPSADHPLLRHPRVLVTPHVAWYSERAVIEMRRKAAEEVRRLLRGEPLLHPVSPEGA
jgi:D-3-phosphoglycerate dehydrogenase